MIIHMFPKSQFTEEFVCFINGHFDEKEHLFVLYTNAKFDLSKEIYDLNNVIDYDKKTIAWLYKTFCRADKIVFHNLAVNFDVLFMLYLNIRFIRKAIWFVWGVDLYCYRIPKVKLIDKFIEKMRRRIIVSFPVIATLTDGDYALAKKWYGVSAKNLRLDYCEEYIISLLHELKNNFKGDDDKQIYILIGNSATETNQHIEILQLLKKFRNENMKLIVPLSYGDLHYADRIEIMGHDLYGDRFIPVRKYLSKKEYYELLSKIDVAIFNNNRQQATGNITALLYLGKKIYLRDDTSMWDEWVNKVGYKIHNIKDISEEEYHDFTKIDEKESAINFKLVNDFFNVENRVKEWKNVFRII